MSPGNEPASSLARGRRRRLLKVYRTVFAVLASYVGLSLANLFRRPEARARALSRWQVATARRVRATILDVQGLFIKVGQLLSILTNVLPAELRRELEGLQDQIPARPLWEIEARLRQELGGGPGDLFATFDPRPLASASLAQVHAATLADGRRVAVKVQHQEIEALARLDLRTIRHVVGIVQWVLGVRGLDAAFAEVRKGILEELDFTQEATYIGAIAANFAADSGVSFPVVIPERSTRRVLTATFVEGIKVSDVDALRARGLDPEPVAERIVRAYCQMIFVDGLYHADPHPGNLLVRADGGIAFLDFGAVARLSPALKEGLPKFLEAVLKRDREEILATLRRMGFVAREGDSDAAERLIEHLWTRFLDQIELESWNLKDLRFDSKLKMELLGDLAKLDIPLSELSAAFTLPKEWLQLQRTLVLLVGLATHLHPEMQPIAIIRPYLEEFVLGRDRDWMALASRVVKDMALSVLSIPDDLKRLLAQARRGEAQLEIRGLAAGASLLYALGHQLLWGAFSLGTGALAYLAWTRGEGTLVVVLGGVSAFFFGCLLVSLVTARKWQRELRRRPVRR
ncbi:MAG TPA: AarF/UbiB family protein [Thermoanaerobaculia bacterium]|nr:AarF/UbiB family protein [Thermoanaerobaculia bacterium]